MSKILKFAGNLNKPVVKFVITKGWYLRLLQKKQGKTRITLGNLTAKKKRTSRIIGKNMAKTLVLIGAPIFLILLV